MHRTRPAHSHARKDVLSYGYGVRQDTCEGLNNIATKTYNRETYCESNSLVMKILREQTEWKITKKKVFDTDK